MKCREYDRDNSGRISEADLCKFLLKNTKVSKGSNQSRKNSKSKSLLEEFDICIFPFFLLINI